MAETLSVSLKGEQRADEEIFVIAFSRGGTTRSIEKTPGEIQTLLDREHLRGRRLNLERREAAFDNVDFSEIERNLRNSQERAGELEAVLVFME